MNMIPYGRGRGTRRTDLRGRDGGKMHTYPLEAARAVLDLHVLDLCTGDPLTGLMHSLTHVQRRERRRGHRAPTARVLLRAPISLAPAPTPAKLCDRTLPAGGSWPTLRRRGNRRPLGAADRPRWLAMRRLAAAPDPDAVRVEAAQDQRAEQQRQRRCEPVV